MAIDVMLTKISAKSGIKKFGGKSDLAMFDKFKQLDDGPVLGNLFMLNINPYRLTTIKKQGSLEVINLIATCSSPIRPLFLHAFSFE